MELGISSEEHENLTASEFNALCEKWEAKREREDTRTASILAMLYNINRGKGAAPKGPRDFISKPHVEQDEDAMMDYLSQFSTEEDNA